LLIGTGIPLHPARRRAAILSSQYRELLGTLAETAGLRARAIPAIGPDYDKLLDQARILAHTAYRTAMILPLASFATPQA
jgi:4-hydroxy-tetrahydrodipicolinate synthase